MGQLKDDKKKITVGVIGHVDHGKTTLTAAITKVLDQRLDSLGNEKPEFIHIDIDPSEKDALNKAIVLGCESQELDVLVVDSHEALLPQPKYVEPTSLIDIKDTRTYLPQQGSKYHK